MLWRRKKNYETFFENYATHLAGNIVIIALLEKPAHVF